MDKPRCFWIVGNFDLPIAGTPEPLPCPFCSTVEDVGIVLARDGAGHPLAHVECSRCGVQAAHAGGDTFQMGYEAVLEAARLWNARPEPVPSGSAQEVANG